MSSVNRSTGMSEKTSVSRSSSSSGSSSATLSLYYLGPHVSLGNGGLLARDAQGLHRTP